MSPSSANPAPRASMRVALLNVKYSPNLGDGLLAECLERELAQALGGAEVFSIDIAGRTGWNGGPGRRRLAMALLEAVPPALRRMAAGAALTLLSRLALRRHVRAGLARCDAAVIGGGNLLTDADLNFPIKLAGAAAEVARRGLPLAVHAVGASAQWSARGRALFARALARRPLAHATVRDERSRQAWARQLEPLGAIAAAVSGDPGLLASLHYPRKPGVPRGDAGRRVGLCITAPLALRYHVGQHHESAATGGAGALHDGAVIEWYGALAQALAQQGLHVILFTNGSPEDRACLVRHAPRWTAERPAADWRGGIARQGQGRISMAAPFATPADLAGFVAGCDLVIAHRMHACIAAHSFAVPTIGLTWDEKLASFFALAGRSQYAVDGPALAPAAIVELAQAALAEGVDRAALTSLIERTRADVAALGIRLASAAQHEVPRQAAEVATASAPHATTAPAGAVLA
ncbi:MULTISPECIES: polysaccharide pyruvyl transferase family protein [unclassified Novosphingobium]|uniref:polysaccharide pyruvyl transferase family protein n=1 Tax=unclassified Novosphingobium TaxID=2644732 RepID=UPI0017B4A5CA|nr:MULTISPECIES: polysaccharide pyruvyl transferase family protein [unclassified Novosphingobium]NMN03565.1 polysaccharide pyruvyl transferase WcaK-like protein [Novosphingobium sp. SG919]NMN86445.1 polysaccharide pyruvyl transferase WcaK-like protein [Novosphingobium sp. SG916]